MVSLHASTHFIDKADEHNCLIELHHGCLASYEEIVCSETSLDFDDYLLRLLSAEGDTQPGMWELIAVSKLLRMTILIFVEEPGGKWLFP